jgi:hypothetical protein
MPGIVFGLWVVYRKCLVAQEARVKGRWSPRLFQ